MPRYEYRCPGCGEVFEQMLSIEERHSGTCTRCGNTGSLMVSRANSRVAIPFSVYGPDGNLMHHQPDAGIEDTERPVLPDSNLREV